jgi:hypothetical protein
MQIPDFPDIGKLEALQKFPRAGAPYDETEEGLTRWMESHLEDAGK